MKNDYEIRGDVTVIYLNYKGQIMETLIDTTDLSIAQSIKNSWRAVRTSWRTEKFYVYGTEYHKREGKTPAYVVQIPLARLLMGFPKGLVVDHINDDSLDNRRSTNLQAITNGQNVSKQIKKRGKGVYRTVMRMAKEKGIDHLYYQ